MIPTQTFPSLSGTFGIRSRLALNPKMPKEPSSPSLPDPLKKNIAAKINDINTRNKNGQLVTSAQKQAGGK